MGYFIKTADMAEGALKAVKNSVKVYNFHANRLDDTMHIADSLNDKLQNIDPDANFMLPTSARLRKRLIDRRCRAEEEDRVKPRRRPWSNPRPRAPMEPPKPVVPRPTAQQINEMNWARWRNLRDRERYIAEHGRYAYDQAARMGKFGETVSCSSDGATTLQLPQLGQMQQNALFARGNEYGEQMRNQELEKIKNRKIKENEAVAPGTNQHRGMDPNKSMMKKMGEGGLFDRLKAFDDERFVRRFGEGLEGEDPHERLRRLQAIDRANRVAGPGGVHRFATAFGAEDNSNAARRREIRRLKRYINLAGGMPKTGEESPEERLRRLEAWDDVQRRKVGTVFGKRTGSFWRDHPTPWFSGTETNIWSASDRANAKRRMEILRLREQLGKKAEEAQNPYDRLKYLEARMYAQDRDRYLSQYNPIGKSLLTTGHMSANPGGQAAQNQRLLDRFEIRSLRRQLGMKPHGIFGTGKILHDTSGEIEKARSVAQAKAKAKPIPKTAAQTDSLGKMHSPAAQGGGVEAPMPQTNYAKNTLENEYVNRLNKKQLSELNRLQQNQNQNSGNQSSSSTTTTSNGTTTTTTTSLTNSGLMAALSLGV